MFDPYAEKMENLAFVFAHAGSKPDGGNRVYAVAASVIKADGTRTAYESPVCYPYFTGRERYYSNVSKETLKSAPPPGRVMDEIREFLSANSIGFVFAYDYRDEISAMRRFVGNPRMIDLGFAAEFFLPFLKSHAPAGLWEHIRGRPRGRLSFSASEIVEMSVELVREICGGTLNDTMHPRASAIRYFLEKSGTLFGDAFVHVTDNFRNYFGGLFESKTMSDTPNWKGFLEKAVRVRKKRPEKKTPKKISEAHVEDLFRATSVSESGFRFRPEQVKYARHVAETFNDSAVLTIEAGTGTGKTRGYLLPVLEYLYRNPGARAVISTYTKSLQEQLFQRELTAATDVFKQYKDIPAALLKGKSSHICAEKVDQVYENEFDGKQLVTWLYFVNLLYCFRGADADSPGEKIRQWLDGDGFMRRMQAEVSAKTGCTPKHMLCPAQVMTQEALSARLVITNHHKFALLDQDAMLSGLFKNCVIDEANHFEHAVRGTFGVEAGSFEIAAALNYPEHAARRIMSRAAGEPAERLALALHAASDLRREAANLREALWKTNRRAEQGTVYELKFNHPAFRDGNAGAQLDILRGDLEKFGKNILVVAEEGVSRMLKMQRRTVERIRMSVGNLFDLADALKMIGDNAALDNHVVSYRVFGKHWILNDQNVEVSELVQNHVFNSKDAVVFTAATLSRNGKFDVFRRMAGMDAEQDDENEAEPREFRFEIIPSPFDKNAMEIVVPENATNGRFGNKKAWLDFVSSALPKLIEKNRGRTLVLFSSYEDLNSVAERVSASLFDSAYPLLIQRKGSPTAGLCDEFREIKESVLFGVDTFWYGVDFKGDTLTQVVITRIPYPSPMDPIQAARKKMMQKEFWARYMYETDIKMKQGIGRLIRCDTDRGRVVILDSRYRSR